MFADDMVLTASSPQGLQKLINTVQAYFQKMSLTVNLDKTKIIVFRRGGRLARDEKWTWMGNEIQVVNEYIYLGIPFTTKGTFLAAVNNMVNKSFKAIDAVISIIRVSRVRSVSVCFRLFSALVASVSSYAAEVWSINYLDILERVYTTFVKKLFLLSRYTASYAIRLETGYYHLRTQLVKKVLLYWTRVLEMTDERFPFKSYIMMRNSDVLFPENRRKTWTKSVEMLLKQLGFGFVWELQDPEIARQYLPHILERVADQRRAQDLGRLTASETYNEYARTKNQSSCESYISNHNLDLYVKQLLFKLRLQLDTFYFDGVVVHFDCSNVCAVCACGRDTLRHLLLDCRVTASLRNPQLSNIVQKFLSPYPTACTDKLLLLFRYLKKCLWVKMQTYP